MKSLAMVLLVLALGCSDDNLDDGSGASGPAGPGAGPGPTSSGVGGMGAGTGDGGAHTDGGHQQGGGGNGGSLDCFVDPQTHEEIINACTDAESVDKVEQVGIWDEGEPLQGLP